MYCQSRYSRQLLISTSGTLIGWPANATSTARTSSGRTTQGPRGHDWAVALIIDVSRTRIQRPRTSWRCFPLGVDENDIDWLFPTIVGRKNIFDKFCVLSLVYRNDGFVIMLSPIRDYPSPKDRGSAPLLCSAKILYGCSPTKPGSTTRTLTSNKPSCTQLTATTHNFWPGRSSCRLGFGIDNIGYGRQSPRH